MKLVSQSQLLPEQTVRLIFGNLDHLVDFQRRFLVGLEDACSVEESAAEKISSLFMMNEAAFAVYGPYCANHRQASDMIVNVAQDLAKIKDGLEPNYELPSYLIKPIQRVCKYPLLFRELSKFLAADERAADKRAVENAYESVNRVTSMVNEIRRKDENIAMVRILEKRVEDWKGFNIHNFGELLLDINLMMERLEVEREMHIFLFERILICCKEVKKEKKRSLSLHRSRTSSLNSEKSYQLKGGVAISQMEGLVSSNRNNTHELKVFYKDSESGEMESFILKYLNEEPMKAWHSTLERLISNFRRKSSMSNASRRSANTHASSSRRSLPTSADGKKSASTSRQNSQAAEHGRYNYPHYSANADKTPMLREQQQQQPAVSTDGEVWTLEKALLELDAFKEESHSDTEDSSSIIITPANPRHHASQSSSSSTPTVTPPVRGSSSASSSSVDSLKVKVHFMDDIFVLMTSVRVQFQELFRQIMQRVNEIDGHVADANSSLKVRYVDEDGDYITIRSDGDLSLAIKLASTGAGRALTLFVSRIEK